MLTSYFFADTSSSLGPISVNCSSAHSTTSPKTSPNTQIGLLTTTESSGQSPEDDDISVTASPSTSPQPPPAFPGMHPPPVQNNQLFNNALAASLFLNAPLLPPPSQWLYSQLYPHDWSWMSLANSHLGSKSSPKEETTQNPDSSSEKLDVTEVDDDDLHDVKDVKEDIKNFCVDKRTSEKHVENNERHCEGINLSLRLSKTAITLVRQKDDVSSNERENARREVNRHVWRPY